MLSMITLLIADFKIKKKLCHEEHGFGK